VTGLYADLLVRLPGPVGLAHLQQVAQSPRGRSQTAEGVLTSMEERLRILDGYYATYLHRPADSQGEQNWLARLQTGRMSPAAVAEAFLTSEEYFGRLSASPR
jgi:hypothetical protein